MLKKLQKVRNVLEEVTHFYAETTELGVALKKEEDAGNGCLTYVSNKATEIMFDINNLIYTNVGYCEYFTVHSKIMTLCAHMVGPTTQPVKYWLQALIKADNEAIQALMHI